MLQASDTLSIQTTTSVGTSSTALLDALPNRIAVIINVPPTNRFTLSLESTAVIDEGITLQSNGNPVIFTIAQHGELVTRAWSAISATSSQNVTVIEVFSK